MILFFGNLTDASTGFSPLPELSTRILAFVHRIGMLPLYYRYRSTVSVTVGLFIESVCYLFITVTVAQYQLPHPPPVR